MEQMICIFSFILFYFIYDCFFFYTPYKLFGFCSPSKDTINILILDTSLAY